MNPSKLLALLLLLASVSVESRAQEPVRDVVVVTRIEGPLADSMMATLRRAIERAETEDAAALIVEIDTPGGEVELMDRLGGVITRTEVPPIAYVVNEAVSAGAYLAMSCDVIYTNEHAQIGSSYPIAISPFGPLPTGMDPNLQEKTLSYLRSKFRDRAQTHDRPGMEALAEAMVDPNIEVLLVDDGGDRFAMTAEEFEDRSRSRGPGSLRRIETICAKGTLLNLTAQEAFDYGFSDGIVLSRTELLEAQGLADAHVIEIGPSWSERMVGALEGFQWLLLVAGLVLLYIELKIPGFGVAGALGLICLALLMFKNYLVGLAEVPEILLVVLGFVLLAIEVFVFPGFGAAGIAGVTCIALGALFSFLPFVMPDGPVESTLLGETLRNFSIAMVAVLVLLLASSKVLPKTPILGRLVLKPAAGADGLQGSAAPLSMPSLDTPVTAGDRGTATSDLSPAGKVDVDGARIDAVSDGDWVGRGEPIEVVRIESNHVVVRAVPARQGETA